MRRELKLIQLIRQNGLEWVEYRTLLELFRASSYSAEIILHRSGLWCDYNKSTLRGCGLKQPFEQLLYRICRTARLLSTVNQYASIWRYKGHEKILRSEHLQARLTVAARFAAGAVAVYCLRVQHVQYLNLCLRVCTPARFEQQRIKVKHERRRYGICAISPSQ